MMIVPNLNLDHDQERIQAYPRITKGQQERRIRDQTILAQPQHRLCLHRLPQVDWQWLGVEVVAY